MIVDFSSVPVGNYVLGNLGPDEPFGSTSSDPATTGQVLQFRVVPAVGVDDSTPPRFLQLPAISPLPPETPRGDWR